MTSMMLEHLGHAFASPRLSEGHKGSELQNWQAQDAARQCLQLNQVEGLGRKFALTRRDASSLRQLAPSPPVFTPHKHAHAMSKRTPDADVVEEDNPKRQTVVTEPPPYAIVLLGEHRFSLSDAQIHFDAPNFFTSAFESGFAESETKVVYSDRSPTLFGVCTATCRVTSLTCHRQDRSTRRGQTSGRTT